MLETVVSLQPRTADASGVSPEDKVYGLAEDLLLVVPEPINIYQAAAVAYGEGGDGSALYVVLIQELQRYNAVLGKIRKSLVNVQKGIKGLVVMSSELDEIYQRMLNGLVKHISK